MKIAWMVVLVIEAVLIGWGIVDSRSRNPDVAQGGAFALLMVLFASLVVDVLLGLITLAAHFLRAHK